MLSYLLKQQRHSWQKQQIEFSLESCHIYNKLLHLILLSTTLYLPLDTVQSKHKESLGFGRLGRSDQCSCVNFNSILLEAFTLVDSESVKKYIVKSSVSFLHFWDLPAQKMYVECWWNWALVSISTAFY